MMKTSKIEFDIKGDDSGSLISLEAYKNIPFEIKRIYYIFNTKDNVRRGNHAHRKLKQVAICVSGSCKFLLDNGNEREIVTLSGHNNGLLIEGLIWREMFDFSKDCVLMVLASEYYNESDYIRNYDDFKKIALEQ